jgi:hypothetical protein
MRKLAIILVLASVLCPACQSGTPPPAPTSAGAPLPAAIERFQGKVASMNAQAVPAQAIAEFGRPSRDIGSGLSIPQWDVAGGVLTVHPLTGPTFQTADGHRLWLMPTSNPAQDNLLQNFEMTTPPDPKNHGDRFWFGNVRITTDGEYRYTDSGTNLGDRGDQSNNFFIKHPEGRVQIDYAAGVAAHSRLEEVGERQIASLRFIPRDGGPPFECKVASSARSRSLSIAASSFELTARWLNYWPNSRRLEDHQ